MSKMPAMKRPAASSIGEGRVPKAQCLAIPKNSKGDTFVRKALKRFLRKLDNAQLKVLNGNLKHHTIRFGSACTGTGMPEAIHAEMHGIFAKQGVSDYSCEVLGFKREFFRPNYCPEVEPRLHLQRSSRDVHGER